MDELVRYLLDDLPPDERAAVDAQLLAEPALASQLERLRVVVGGLEPVPVEPPAGLAAATVARTAEYLVAHGLFVPPPEPEVPAEPARMTAGWPNRDPAFLPVWRRADVAVAFSIGFLAAGLALGAIGKLRNESHVRGCQDGLRGFHAALVGYADDHGGRLPQVGTAAVPAAGAVADELIRSGRLWAPEAATCPTADRPGYAYTLGYVAPTGQVVGTRLSDPGDWAAVAADPPGGPHPRGQNVLYAGGTVRFASTPAAGAAGDDIYANDAGLVRAGLHARDASLGTGSAVP